MKADAVVRKCVILPMVTKEIIEDGLIAIENGKITYAGKRSSAPHFQAEMEIDGKNMVAIPGLINCHTHVPMTLFRGIAEDKPLETWLKKTIWPLESKLKPADVYTGALLGCLEMIKSGTTCFADMYFHEDRVAKAVEETGLRGILAEGIIGTGKTIINRLLLRRSIRFARKFKGKADGRINVMLGPHAVYTCGKELLEKIRDEASKINAGIHIHLAESKTMLEQSWKVTEVESLDRMNFFQNPVLAAHCVYLSNKDIQLLTKRNVRVAYVPVANMKLGLDIARANELVQSGICTGLGTDGPASNNSLDLFETMKTGVLLQKHLYHDPTVLSAYDILRMATFDGAKAIGLDKKVGALEAGKKADIVLIDFRKPHLTPSHDVYANIVYSARGSDVDTVIVDGRILMHNRQVCTLDEKAMIEKAQNTAFNLLSR